MIYGVALLAACMLTGSFIGNVLGHVIGLGSDVGGVGFAMLLLIFVTNSKKIKKILPAGSMEGMKFWQNMFIPITIAMSASQNVYQALEGGAVALIAGILAVALAFLMLLLLNAATKKQNKDKKEDEACKQ